MDYQLPDSSGTDDDLPPTHNNRASRGSRVLGNGRSVITNALYPRMHSDMESQIHLLEQEAYCSVLRAFKAQSDAITWEKEGLITELRKELRMSDDEHRELLTKVNADDVIRRIREWRQAGGHYNSMLSTPQPGHDLLPSPTVSGSRKRHKTAQSGPLSFGMQPQALHPQPIATSMQPPSSATKKGPASGPGGKKPKPGQLVRGLSLTRAKPYAAPSGRELVNRSSSGAIVTNASAEAGTDDPLIGRKVMTRWPDDSNFYEAVISSYNPADGRHALAYYVNTPNENWEWVDLKKISPEDIRWIGDDPGIPHREGRGGYKSHLSSGGGVPPPPPSGDGRGISKGGSSTTTKDQLTKEIPPSSDNNNNNNGGGGAVKRLVVADEIEILHTETLLKEVDKVCAADHPDLSEIEKAKKMLKEHEQALMDVIAKLAVVSDDDEDSESERDQHQHQQQLQPQSHHHEQQQQSQSVEGQGRRKKQQYERKRHHHHHHHHHHGLNPNPNPEGVVNNNRSSRLLVDDSQGGGGGNHPQDDDEDDYIEDI